MGQDRVHREVDGSDVVNAGGNPGANQDLDDDADRAGECAHVGQGPDAIAKHFPVGVRASSAWDPISRPWVALRNSSRRVGVHFGRTSQFPRGIHDDDIFPDRNHLSCRTRRQQQSRGCFQSGG